MALGTTEIAIIVIAAIILLFGASQIPKLARSMGRAKGEFQKAQKEFQQGIATGQGSKPDDGPPEEQIRAAARDLGIDEADMSLEEVKKALNEKLPA